ELGDDGRLVLLQRDELMGDFEDERRLVIRDYVHDLQDAPAALERLGSLSGEDLLDLQQVAGVLGLPADLGQLDSSVQPRGHRLLSRVPRLPAELPDQLVRHFGTLQKIMRATHGDLVEATGADGAAARLVKDGLARLAETSILDRYS
ncbi:MAG TPA: hypothetical protein VE152_03685, partial [Acidimicrobiales bacterium]|nr:hypothetical protein [Acidimicrobiales bacterium]